MPLRAFKERRRIFAAAPQHRDAREARPVNTLVQDGRVATPALAVYNVRKPTLKRKAGCETQPSLRDWLWPYGATPFHTTDNGASDSGSSRSRQTYAQPPRGVAGSLRSEDQREPMGVQGSGENTSAKLPR